MTYVLDIDLKWIVKDFELPLFMKVIIQHENTIEKQTQEIANLKKMLKEKNKLLNEKVEICYFENPWETYCGIISYK